MAIIIEHEDDPSIFPGGKHSITFTDGERPPVIDVDGIFHVEIDWDQDAPAAKGILCRRTRHNDLVMDARIVPDRWSNTPDGLKLWFHFDFN